MERGKDHVRCITVVHPLHKIREYREFSAFFRLMGIFVCENIAGEDYGDPTDYKIVIQDGNGQDSVKNLPVVLTEMDEVFSVEAIQIFQEIYNIFNEYDLMRASYAIAYFFDAKEDYIYDQMLAAYDQFDNAWKDFCELENQVTDKAILKYIWAAKSNCRRRMNELYTIVWDAAEKGWYAWYPKDEKNSRIIKKAQKARDKIKETLWDKKYFSYADINEDIQKIIDADPDFYGAYVIRGFAAELDDDYRFDSVSDLLTALNIIGNQSYSSYLCYRIGKYYETIRKNHDSKWTYYRMAWERDPHNYRALYKLVLKEQADGNLEEADMMWGQLIGILEAKKDSLALQPIECAYLFKGYYNRGKLYIKRERYSEGILCLQKAKQVFKNQRNEDKAEGFYPWMFKETKMPKDPEDSSQGDVESWEKYKSAAKNKLMIQDVYIRLANAAADTGDKVLYESYYPRALE